MDKNYILAKVHESDNPMKKFAAYKLAADKIGTKVEVHRGSTYMYNIVAPDINDPPSKDDQDTIDHLEWKILVEEEKNRENCY